MTYLNDVYDYELFKNIKKIKKPLRIGTDCSGIEAPIMALKLSRQRARIGSNGPRKREKRGPARQRCRTPP